MPIVLSRYDELSMSITPLNPLEDAVAWISSLRSKAYTSDLLRSVHGVSDRAQINRLTMLIETYAANALGFLDQAYSGPPEVSFLPLYYAVLNLSKITIITSGLDGNLENQPLHGASYSTTTGVSRSLLTETITLHRRGAFPLLYRALTGTQVGFTTRPIQMRDVYPFLSGITYEYEESFSAAAARQSLAFDVVKTEARKFRLIATAANSRHPNANKLRYLKALSGFRKVANSPNQFASPIVIADTMDAAEELLKKKVRRFLLYNLSFTEGNVVNGVDTPLSSARIFLPEEIPIWIALFHLSSVARYNPIFLSKLEDSKYWPVLLSMRKHVVLRYLILFWSNIHKKNFVISVG